MDNLIKVGVNVSTTNTYETVHDLFLSFKNASLTKQTFYSILSSLESFYTTKVERRMLDEIPPKHIIKSQIKTAFPEFNKIDDL